MSHQRRAFARFLPLCLAVAAGWACGGPTQLDPDEGFRRIQVHEATIENSEAEARACPPNATCPARERICAAADGVCGLAEELDDRDAQTRCDRARAQCPRPPR